MERQPCPGCGRSRRECWNEPCAHLRSVVEQGHAAIKAWVEAGAGKLRARPIKPAWSNSINFSTLFVSLMSYPKDRGYHVN